MMDRMAPAPSSAEAILAAAGGNGTQRRFLNSDNCHLFPVTVEQRQPTSFERCSAPLCSPAVCAKRAGQIGN
jgi:hypothetical protein